MGTPVEQQGSLHYTPEHCLVNGGVLFILVEKDVFQLGNMYLLRSPEQPSQLFSDPGKKKEPWEPFLGKTIFGPASKQKGKNIWCH